MTADIAILVCLYSVARILAKLALRDRGHVVIVGYDIGLVRPDPGGG